MASSQARESLRQARRVVVKIGSRALAAAGDMPQRLARQIVDLSQTRRSFVVVSSGAIALGVQRLGYRSRPREMAKLQAAAAAGQSILMHRYEKGFEGSPLTAAQVLLTHADLADRERLNNARQALGALLEAGAVPIINENDTVSTEEIRFGDNDQLAAMVAPLVGAELLVLLTDVTGVLDAAGQRISVLSGNAPPALASGDSEQMGTGGMPSKLDAAYKASRSGASVVIASATDQGGLEAVLGGMDVGTLVPATGPAMRARKHWIAFTLRPRGTVILDEGAVQAVQSGRGSVLPVGVLGVRGQFNPGDSVRLVAPDGAEVARGLTRLGALDVARAAGHRSQELQGMFGVLGGDLVVVHKDDLVLE
jgi:glutamate 5-kinase